MAEPRGEVFDLGYRHYDGPREGRMRARKALWANGVRTALGLGRGSRAKVLPVLFFVAAIIPAVVLALVASQVDEVVGPGAQVDIPSHGDYYQIISIILLLFSAIIAPELLCPDRREGVIYLYLVRPLTTTDYVAGRWLAFLSITLAIAYSGQVILFIGFVLAAAEPFDYLRDNWLDVPRFLAAGLVVALFTTTIPLAVSAFTTRRAYATAFVIGLYFISFPAAGILTGCDEETDQRRPAPQVEELGSGPCEPITGDAAKWFGLIDLGKVPIHINDLIFNEKSESTVARLVQELPNGVPIGWYLFLTAGPGVVLWWQYRKISV
ncbi:MAG: ABC transporter permease subunit [Chloroflexi bacterium]|nr:ABC transporter permease subunit [Chloroflexota bacterium]MCZ6789435.1 ABC transporter permease subunit [Chloroflexota bacterium]